MTLPRLNAVLDWDLANRRGWRLPDLARAYLAGGARFLQMRAKTLPAGEFLRICDEIVRLARDSGAAVVVDDRPDIAMLAAASGVHVGQDDLPPAAVRAIVGDGLLVGLSTHTVDQVMAACQEPVDYIAVGPIFGTQTKDTGVAPVGVSFVRQATAIVSQHPSSDGGVRPIVAIGGITLDRCREVIAAGASSVAVISDLLIGDASARVRAYLNALDGQDA